MLEEKHGISDGIGGLMPHGLEIGETLDLRLDFWCRLQ
jgi:hypothetical protein